MINYWTIMIEKSDKTANLQTLNYNIGHLDKFTEARRKYLLNVTIVTLVVNQTEINVQFTPQQLSFIAEAQFQRL